MRIKHGKISGLLRCLTGDDMLHTLDTNTWENNFSDTIQQDAIKSLESGQVIFLPRLSFQLNLDEMRFLTPDCADPQAKNISYYAPHHRLWGVQGLTDQEHIQLKTMLERFSSAARNLVEQLFPHYQAALMLGRTSFRPMQVSQRKTSFRKDDRRLHVDSFPSAPNQGKRILRVFCNINPHGKARVWRLGEPFQTVAERFIPHIKKPIPGFARLLRLLKITKSYRTPYDHYMLRMHDRMKQNSHYQQNAQQQEVHFPAQSSWIVQTDSVSHAALDGQYLLEQTFYLPVDAMQDKNQAPLSILESLLKRRLA